MLVAVADGPETQSGAIGNALELSTLQTIQLQLVVHSLNGELGHLVGATLDEFPHLGVNRPGSQDRADDKTKKEDQKDAEAALEFLHSGLPRSKREDQPLGMLPHRIGHQIRGCI
jgi:hypothetical protein